MVQVACDSVRMRVFPNDENEREAAVTFFELVQIFGMPPVLEVVPLLDRPLTAAETQRQLLNSAVARNIHRLLRAGYTTTHPFSDAHGESLEYVLAWATYGADMLWHLDSGLDTTGLGIFIEHASGFFVTEDGRRFPDTDEVAMEAFCRRYSPFYH